MALDRDSLPRDIMRALGFLTRLPVPARWFEGGDHRLTRTARAFPLAGMIAAVPAIAVLCLGALIDLPPLLCATLAVAALAATGGGLHEDGLADVADGFFGGREKERRLDIMKDSRIGAFGAMALVLLLMVRAITIAAILNASLTGAILALAGSQAIARATLVWHWTSVPPAKSDGLAAAAGQPDDDAKIFALATGIGLALVLAILARGLWPALFAMLFAGCAALAINKLSNAKIGGHTGDTLGASALVAELAFLTGLASGL